MKNIILITGASSGIGKEFVRQIDQYFMMIDELWLIARNQEKLRNLANTLKHKTRILPMDITSPDFTEELTKIFLEGNVCIRMLINCAGYGIMGNVARLTPEELCGMVRLNCEALTKVTSCCIPYMKRGSRIIQLASSAAFLPQPGFAVYAATKSYVLSFSRALSEELRRTGIYVTGVCPGPVDTPFFEIAEKYSQTLAIKKFTMTTVDKVVSKALRDSYYKKTMSVCSLPIQVFAAVSKLFPHQVILWVMRFVKRA